MFQNMTWLTSRRMKLYGGGMAIAFVLIFANVIRVWFHQGGYALNGDLFGQDYSSFWAASAQALRGRPAEVYVPQLHLAAERPYLQNGYAAFFYPPTFLLLCLPFALISYFASYILFISAAGAAFAAVIWKILRSPWSLAATLSYTAVYLNIIAGQNAFLTATILGCGLGLLDKRPRLAGSILGLMVIKPHLALGFPIALIVAGRWRTLIWAGISSVAFVALSYLLFGRETWLGFVAISDNARVTMENGDVEFGKLQSVFVTARALGASVRTAYVLHGIVALVAISALVWALRKPVSTDSERSMIVVASLLITPFLLFYDTVILLLPMAWMFREWRRCGFPPWSKLVLCVAMLAPLIDYAPVIYNLSFVKPLPFALPVLLLFGGLLIREIAQSRFKDTAPGRDQARDVGRLVEMQ